jgi:hypothetical protein
MIKELSALTGYPTFHVKDVYRLINLDAKSLFISRDTIWMNKCYGEWSRKRRE